MRLDPDASQLVSMDVAIFNDSLLQEKIKLGSMHIILYYTEHT